MHRWQPVRALKLLPLIALSGCESPGYYDAATDPNAPEQQMIATDSRSYGPSAVVTLRLTNTANRTLGYNLCRSSLERRQESDWGPVQPTLAEACTAELRTLFPGQSVTYQFRLAPQLRRGSYRIRTVLHDTLARGNVSAVSAPFGIERGGSD